MQFLGMFSDFFRVADIFGTWGKYFSNEENEVIKIYLLCGFEQYWMKGIQFYLLKQVMCIVLNSSNQN